MVFEKQCIIVCKKKAGSDLKNIMKKIFGAERQLDDYIWNMAYTNTGGSQG
ncbi:MAG: hypothetical protein K2L86_07550 [Lachnospiraceae bacterium]|nr:hypothetical protein [Lachnospiraceae bacterium]